MREEHRSIEHMTAEERRLVRDTYASIRDVSGPLALLFYGRLFELDPPARRLFHNDLALQGRKLMDTLDALVASLDRFDLMRERLSALGRQHAEYGVKPEQYDTLTTALLWAFGQALGADFDAAARDAWRIVLAAVTTVMRDAAAAAVGSAGR